VAVRWQRRSRGERDQGRAGAKLHAVHMITLLHIDSATGASPLSVHLRLRSVPITIIPPLRVANWWPASFAHTKYAHTMRQEQLRSNPDDQWRPLDASITSAARPEESLKGTNKRHLLQRKLAIFDGVLGHFGGADFCGPMRATCGMQTLSSRIACFYYLYR